MPDREEALQKYAEGDASRYYQQNADPLAEPLRALIARLKLKSGEAVLDVGCGSGFSLMPIESAVGPVCGESLIYRRNEEFATHRELF